MPATPLDIAKYTVDGQTATYVDSVLKTNNPQARDLGEINTFFRYIADVQAMLTEKQTNLANPNPLHETIEVGEALGIGNDVPVTPTVPTFTIVDDSRSINQLGRTLAVAFDTGTDRYSVEVVG